MRPLTMRRLVIVVGLLALLACRPDTTLPIERDVGVHRLRFAVPTDWQHSDLGREQRFDQGFPHITLSDLGPATSRGFAREIRRARKLFRHDQWEDARTLLVALKPRRVFTGEEQWKSVSSAWGKVTRIDRDLDAEPPWDIPTEVEWAVNSAYTELLAHIAAQPDSNLETLAMAALVELGHDSLRGVAESHATSISGRPALQIDTWDRLSHVGRRRHLFVLNEGNLLCLRMELGSFEVMEPAFEAIVANLTIREDQRSGGA